MRQFATLALSAVISVGAASTAHASSIAFDLNCVVGHPTGGQVQCGGSVPSYGTVTFDDSPGNGDILLKVDLTGTGEKFKDLFFNYNGAAAGITAGDGATNLLDPNSLSHAPYTGNFDVGAFAGDDGYSVVLYGWNSGSANLQNSTTAGGANVALTLANFQVLDTRGQTYVALHIQNIGPNGCSAGGPLCTPGTTGGGSMNAVGSNGSSRPDVQITAEVPEPASLLLFATGLAGLGRTLRRRRSLSES